MQNWEYMTVQVCLDASSCVYTVICKDKRGRETEQSLSEFLLDIGKQGWEYVELIDNILSLKRLHQQ
jgi:hypothetical protein